jgi:drug/metabolite transporter (DMT)-like permease
MKIFIALILLVLMDSAGNLLVAKGMKQGGEISTIKPRELLKIVRNLAKNPNIRLGFLFQACTFFLLLTLLSWANLSLVVPLASSSYIISLLGAQFLLKEKVTRARWIGTLLVGAGVTLVSLSS